MYGLLVKDFRLLLQRKRYFVLLLGIAFMFSLYSNEEFAVGYLCILCSIFSLSTINYDEFDNCYPFLMTLPAERKEYVAEKYLFGILFGGIAWILGCGIYFIAMIYKAKTFDVMSTLLDLAVFIPVILLMLSIYIPFYIKYGCERGKVIMLMVCGGVFAGGFVIAKLFKTPPTWLQGTLDSINNGNDKMALLCLAVIIVLLTVISYFCSVSIMEKKEF